MTHAARVPEPRQAMPAYLRALCVHTEHGLTPPVRHDLWASIVKDATTRELDRIRGLPIAWRHRRDTDATHLRLVSGVAVFT